MIASSRLHWAQQQTQSKRMTEDYAEACVAPVTSWGQRVSDQKTNRRSMTGTITVTCVQKSRENGNNKAAVAGRIHVRVIGEQR